LLHGKSAIVLSAAFSVNHLFHLFSARIAAAQNAILCHGKVCN
jgi:hypothetical protein